MDTVKVDLLLTEDLRGQVVGVWRLVSPCPVCGRKHRHSAGLDFTRKVLLKSTGPRVPHCHKGGGDYRLVWSGRVFDKRKSKKEVEVKASILKRISNVEKAQRAAALPGAKKIVTIIIWRTYSDGQYPDVFDRPLTEWELYRQAMEGESDGLMICDPVLEYVARHGPQEALPAQRVPAEKYLEWLQDQATGDSWTRWDNGPGGAA